VECKQKQHPDGHIRNNLEVRDILHPFWDPFVPLSPVIPSKTMPIPIIMQRPEFENMLCWTDPGFLRKIQNPDGRRLAGKPNNSRVDVFSDCISCILDTETFYEAMRDYQKTLMFGRCNVPEEDIPVRNAYLVHRYRYCKSWKDVEAVDKALLGLSSDEPLEDLVERHPNYTARCPDYKPMFGPSIRVKVDQKKAYYEALFKSRRTKGQRAASSSRAVLSSMSKASSNDRKTQQWTLYDSSVPGGSAEMTSWLESIEPPEE
jgi:hypothetical protein